MSSFLISSSDLDLGIFGFEGGMWDLIVLITDLTAFLLDFLSFKEYIYKIFK